jgi:hypothetical protein
MGTPADFLRFITQAAEEAVTFDGDVVALASGARNGDNDAVAELIRAYAAIACLTGIRLRPSWLPMPDAAQEAMLVLRRLIVEGSITIATELPSAIAANVRSPQKAARCWMIGRREGHLGSCRRVHRPTA